MVGGRYNRRVGHVEQPRFAAQRSGRASESLVQGHDLVDGLKDPIYSGIARTDPGYRFRNDGCRYGHGETLSPSALQKG